MTDIELLRQYVDRGSQEPFAQLVRVHVDAVYSAARRQARGNDALAEEITQQVFILFAQKASTFKPEVIIGGWLYNAVRFVARDEIRKADLRTQHEKKAAAMAEEMRRASAPEEMHGKNQDAWDQAEDVLDDAMNDLDEQTRGLLGLRFFEGKTAGEVGQRLGITEEAARKRLSRAVDQLREMFQRRGVVMSAGALTEALVAKAIIHAPPHLAATAASAASAATASASAASTGIIKTGIAFMTASKANLLAASIVGALLLGGGIVAGTKGLFWSSSTPHTVQIPQSSGSTLAGTVRDSAGRPVASAELQLCVQGKSINIYDKPAAGANMQTTSADGSFSINKPAEHFELVVRSSKGYAQISGETLAKSSDVVIAPWGRVEGILLARDKPVANAPILTYETPAPYGFTTVMRQMKTTTDADGHFIFDHVAPGEIRIAQLDPITKTLYRWAYAIVEPGTTATVKIGGTGRAVVGRFVNPPATQPIVWDYRSTRLLPTTILRTTNFPVVQPEHRSGETLEEWRQIEETFGRTPEGAKLKLMELGGWNFRVQPDGTFRVDDVPAGEYVIEASILKLDPHSPVAKDYAKGQTALTIAPMPGERSDEPQNVGDIEMKLGPTSAPSKIE